MFYKDPPGKNQSVPTKQTSSSASLLSRGAEGSQNIAQF